MFISPQLLSSQVQGLAAQGLPSWAGQVCTSCCCCLISFCAYQQVHAEVAAQATQETTAAHQVARLAQHEAASLQTALHVLQSDVERTDAQHGLVEQLQAEVASLQQQLQLAKVLVSLHLYTDGARVSTQIDIGFRCCPLHVWPGQTTCMTVSMHRPFLAFLQHPHVEFLDRKERLMPCLVKRALIQTSLPTASNRCPLHTVALETLLLTIMKPVWPLCAGPTTCCLKVYGMLVLVAGCKCRAAGSTVKAAPKPIGLHPASQPASASCSAAPHDWQRAVPQGQPTTRGAVSPPRGSTSAYP